MALTDAARNLALNGITAAATWVGLADRSLTELTGGSPAYARLQPSWGSAASGQAASTAAMDFNVAGGGTEVCFVLLRSAVTAGTDYGWSPAQGGLSAAQRLPFGATVLASSDTFTSYAHGLTTNDQVVVLDISATTVPAGITEGTIYYVRSTGLTTDAFTLSATLGGGSIAVTADGEVFIQRVVPEVFASQGNYTIGVGELTLDGRVI